MADENTTGRASEGAREPAAQNDQRERLWSPIFVLIMVISLGAFLTGQGLNSATSVYIDHQGGSAAYAGALATVFSFAAGVARILGGRIIDGRGRALVMFAGALILAAGTALPLVNAGVAMFVIARTLQGIGFAAVTTAAATAAVDVLPASRMGEGVGYAGLGQAISMSIGPALAIALVSMDPPEMLFIGMTGIALVAGLLVLACRYERNPASLPETSGYRTRWERGEVGRKARAAASAGTPTASDAGNGEASGSQSAEKGSAWRSYFEPRALPGALPVLVLSPVFGFGIFFVGLYGTTLGVAGSGLFYTVSAVTMILSRVSSGAYMDRIAPIKIFAFACSCCIAAFLLLLTAPVAHVAYYAAGVFYGFGLGISNPLLQSVAVKNTPADRWGAANALFYLCVDLGIGFAAPVWGAINDTFGFQATMMCVICCAVAAFCVALFTFSRVGATKAQSG